MKRTVITLGIALMAVTLTACDVTPGSACSQVNSETTNADGSAYVCRATPGGKKIWQPAGNAPVKPDRP